MVHEGGTSVHLPLLIFPFVLLHTTIPVETYPCLVELTHQSWVFSFRPMYPPILLNYSLCWVMKWHPLLFLLTDLSLITVSLLLSFKPLFPRTQNPSFLNSLNYWSSTKVGGDWSAGDGERPPWTNTIKKGHPFGHLTTEETPTRPRLVTEERRTSSTPGSTLPSRLGVGLSYPKEVGVRKTH